MPGSCAVRRSREGCGVFGVRSDAVSACTVHPVRLGETAGMPPVAGFPASGHGPCHRPACPSCGSRDSVSRHHERRDASFERPRWAGTSGRGSRFACRVATASETPSRERCGGLRRPGGPQSNRQFLPVVLDRGYAVRGINSGGCGGVVGFISAVNGGAFSSILRKLPHSAPSAHTRLGLRGCRQKRSF